MTMKAAFKSLLDELGIHPSETFEQMSAEQFGALFFSFSRTHGYDIANSPAQVLARLDIEPSEVIDVGVYDGTPWLYSRFPSAHHILVEPQKDPEARLLHRPNSYTLVNLALGSANETLTLTSGNERSSLLSRLQDGVASPPTDEQYDVEVTTLDDIILQHCKSNTIGLKIDVEGFEQKVLAGLKECPHRIMFVIIELSVRNRFDGEAHFSAIVELLSSIGFRFYNIMNTARPVPPNAYDVIFLRSDDPAFKS